MWALYRLTKLFLTHFPEALDISLLLFSIFTVKILLVHPVFSLNVVAIATNIQGLIRAAELLLGMSGEVFIGKE